MPVNNFEASLWCYQDFFRPQKNNFWREEPKDWARLQIWDGEKLKPAMPENFKGAPSQELMNTLYEYAQKGQLVLFELGSNAPRMLGAKEQTRLPLDGQEPVAPPENATGRQKSEYERQKVEFARGQELLKQLGNKFITAVNAFNARRDMQWENEEINVRNACSHFEEVQRNRNKAESVISEAFAPKPIASGNIYYKDANATRDASFNYEDVYTAQMEPNGYELPENDKVSDYDAATITFAMFGAQSVIEDQVRQRHQDMGPVRIQRVAPDMFMDFVTGMFGWSRVGQQMHRSNYMSDVMQQSKADILEYIGGNPEPLGKHLGESVRTIKNMFTNAEKNAFSRDMVAATRLTARLMGLFDKDPALLQAAGLREQDMEFMRGYVQMGNILDNYLQSRIKLESAKSHGQNLSAEERSGILADIVIRRMVERELTKENNAVKASDAYKEAELSAKAKDQAIEAAYQQYIKDELEEMADTPERAQKMEAWRKQNDANENVARFISYPVDYDIIQKLAQPGMLERLRETLMNDPLLMERAQLDDFGIHDTKVPLESGDDLDALVEQLNPTMVNAMTTDDQRQTWFDGMKALLTAGQNHPWLNPKVASDADRLMIAMPNGEGGKELVSVASRLSAGLNRLENPDENTLDLLYKNALAGNLYYYQLGEDLPQRISVDGKRTSVQKLEPPAEPNFLQWLLHAISGGRWYADLFNQQPDRDPAALKAFLGKQESRKAASADEIARHAELANKTNEVKEEQKDMVQEEKPEQEIMEKITRGLKPYDAHVVSQAMRHMTYTETTVPANTLGIDGAKLGVLVTMALASPDLSIKMKDGSLQNNPDETYKKVIDRYKDNVAIDKKGRTGGFLSKAKNAVIEGMEAAQNSGDYSKLGKLVAQGLIQNNKMLMGFKQLDDRFSTYATIGTRVLDMLNANPQLKQATLAALDGDTKQLDMANAAKNINNLRVEAMPLYEKMLNEFSQTVKKRTWDKDTGKAKMKPDNATMGNTRDLTKVLQLCNIEVAMNAGEFNLQTTEYAKNGVVEKYSQELGKSSVLISFLAGENRVETLKDPMKMKDLYVNATNERKQAAEEIQQARLEMAMENQPKEQSVVSMPQ